jgi:hypothetical protein
MSINYSGNKLIRDVLKLDWSANKFLPNLVGKLNYCEEIANAEPEAHFGLYLAFNIIW